MTNLLIAYPDIPKRAVKIESTHTWSALQPVDNLRAGPRYTTAKLASSTTEVNRLNFDLGNSTASTDFLAIARADRLAASNVTKVTLKGSSQSPFSPSTLTGLKAWYDTTRTLTIDSSGGISQLNDLSTFATHATQATAANRPILTRSDNKENRCTRSEEMGAWAAVQASVGSNVFANPLDGSVSADRVIDTVVNAQHYITSPSANVLQGESIEFSIYARSAELNWIIFERTGTAFAGSRYSFIDLSTGSVSVGAGVAATAVSVGGGWYKVSMTETASTAGTAIVRVTITNGNGVINYAGTGTSGVYLWGSQIRTTLADSTYIIATTWPQLRGHNANKAASFDGTNDGFTTTYGPTVSSGFSGAVFVRPAVVALGSILGSWSTATSRFQIYLNSGGGIECYVFNSTANYIGRTAPVNTYVANEPFVLSFTYDGTTSATGISIYKNGAKVDTASATAGAYTVPVGAGQVLEIGTRAVGTSLYFNGLIGDAIVAEANWSTATRQAAEAYLTSKWISPPVINETSLNTSTRYGPGSRDYYSIVSASSAFRHWWLEYEASAATTFEHSKIYFGRLFDFDDKVDDFRIYKIDSKEVRTYSNSGAVSFSKNEVTKYRVEITWRGVSDAVLRDFHDKVLDSVYRDRGLFLITTTDHTILDNQRILHVQIVEYGDLTISEDFNEINCVFEELVG